MQIIHNPAEAALIADPELRVLVEKTMADLSPDAPYNPAVLGGDKRTQEQDIGRWNEWQQRSKNEN